MILRKNANSFELCQFLRIRLKLGEERNNLAQEVAQGIVQERRPRQGIADSGSLPPGTDQIRGAQDGEVAGHERLRESQHLLQIPNAETLSMQKVDNTQARAIRQRFE